MEYKPTPASGYGKGPVWQKILIYLVIGGIAYGLIYYFVFRKSGGGYENNANAPYTAPSQSQPSPATSVTNPPAPAPISTPAPATPSAKSFTVHANDNSADLTTITVSKGTPVQITFSVDAEGTYHGGLDFRSSVVSTGPISPGSSKTINFTANSSFAFVPYWPATNIQKPYTIKIVVQ